MTTIKFSSRISGADLRRLLAAERDNEARLQSCAEHRFPAITDEWNKKYACAICGGAAKTGYIRAYCEGFFAHGGDPKEICPNIDMDAQP